MMIQSSTNVSASNSRARYWDERKRLVGEKLIKLSAMRAELRKSSKKSSYGPCSDDTKLFYGKTKYMNHLYLLMVLLFMTQLFLCITILHILIFLPSADVTLYYSPKRRLMFPKMGPLRDHLLIAKRNCGLNTLHCNSLNRTKSLTH